MFADWKNVLLRQVLLSRGKQVLTTGGAARAAAILVDEGRGRAMWVDGTRCNLRFGGVWFSLALRNAKFFFYLETVPLDKRVCRKVVAENYRIGRGSNDTWPGVVGNSKTSKFLWY